MTTCCCLYPQLNRALHNGLQFCRRCGNEIPKVKITPKSMPVWWNDHGVFCCCFACVMEWQRAS